MVTVLGWLLRLSMQLLTEEVGRGLLLLRLFASRRIELWVLCTHHLKHLRPEVFGLATAVGWPVLCLLELWQHLLDERVELPESIVALIRLIVEPLLAQVLRLLQHRGDGLVILVEVLLRTEVRQSGRVIRCHLNDLHEVPHASFGCGGVPEQCINVCLRQLGFPQHLINLRLRHLRLLWSRLLRLHLLDRVLKGGCELRSVIDGRRLLLLLCWL